ncbi:hypothetical protein MMC27_008119 [Xylographa pallens]|nr:hypothetical protein [Xylographa pallens]
MYKPILPLVAILCLLVPSFANPGAEVRVPIDLCDHFGFIDLSLQLLPRQAGPNGATAQLSLLSTIDQSSSMSSSMSSPSSMLSSSLTTTTPSASMSTTLPASVSASISASMASVSASISLATNAVTGGGSGSGDTGGVGGANSSDAVARGVVRWGWVGVLVAAMGIGAAW